MGYEARYEAPAPAPLGPARRRRSIDAGAEVVFTRLAERLSWEMDLATGGARAA